MITVVTRVLEARVRVEGQVVGEIGRGLLALAAVCRGDGEKDLAWTAGKLVQLRVFPDDADKAFDRDVLQVGGSILLVSNFTVAAETKRGRRPSFDPAMPPAEAEPVFARFVELVGATGVPVATGRFGANMQVASVNDGPVTFLLDSRAP
jgi:D-tyrosyl-tRNA(Tyr) deacylase